MSEVPGRHADLTTVVDGVLRRLPRQLADEPARAGLRSVARMLPASLTGGPIGLEIRLRGPRIVDLFAAAHPGEPGFGALVDALRRRGSETRWADPSRAADLADALDRWARRRGALPRVARYLLVEADAPEPADAPIPVPSIFLAPRGSWDIPRPGQPPNAFQRAVDVTTMAAAELSGVWPDPTTATALAAVVDSLPASADIFAVGAMISRRAGASMRVAVRRLEPTAIHTVLSAAHRPRQAALIAEWVATTAASQTVIAFDVGPGAEDRVGLELATAHDWQLASDEGWPALLDEVVARGVADVDRVDRVLGLIDAESDPLWGLAHVKVAADTHGILPVSKLYVGLLHRWAPA